MCSDEGSALVELALAVSILFPVLVIGIVAIGGLVYDTIEVSDAAHAGASYAVQYFRSSNAFPTNVATVTLAAEPDIPASALTTSPVTVTCSCSAPATGSCTSPAVTNTTCGSNVLYVTVATQANVTPLFNLSKFGFPATVNMKGAATFELAP
jgi:Flp pilus assembly protein TadG